MKIRRNISRSDQESYWSYPLHVLCLRLRIIAHVSILTNLPSNGMQNMKAPTSVNTPGSMIILSVGNWRLLKTRLYQIVVTYIEGKEYVIKSI